MAVRVADKLQQFNDGDYMLVDASAVEYKQTDGSSISVQQALENGAGGTVDLSGYVKTYTTIGDLGLTAPVTVGDIFNAMEDKTIAMIACEGTNYHITDIPGYYGILTIKRAKTGRFSIEFQSSSAVSATDVKRWIGTLKGTDGTELTWKLISTQTTYTTIEDLGLTAPITVGEIFNAMPNKTMAILSCEDIADHITDVPMSHGVLTIKKSGVGRFSIDYQNSLFGSPCDVKRWIGTLKGADGTQLYWKLISTYTELSDMGLTAEATVQDVIDKLQIGESCCIRTDAFTNWSTLFNGIQWGYLKITKTVNGLCEIWVNDITSDNRLYYGIQASGKFSKWQQVQTRLTYVSLTQMGLTADATIDDVINALKEGETALISTNEFTNYKEGMFPNQCANDQYAVIKVEKESGSKVFLEWRQKEGNAYAIGGLNGSNKFTNWNNLVRFKKDGFADDSIVCIGDTLSNDGVIQTLANLGFSNDIMTWDTGIYRVSHVSGLINLPSDITIATPGFRLEHLDCKKWGGNHNPSTKTWAIRHSILYAEGSSGKGGNVYHRYTESGNTAGTYVVDTGWQKIQTENWKVITADTITKYGTEILKYPIGTWHIDSVNLGKQFTDLPLTGGMAGIIEIDSIYPTKSPYEHAYGYRNYTIRDALTSNIYIRTLNSGDTAGTLQRDTGWKKVCTDETRLTTVETQVSELFQSVSDGKTLVANAITGKGVSTSTTATFATMATNISKIPQTTTWKEETVSASPNSDSHIARFVFSNTVYGVRQLTAPGYHYGAETTETKMFTINSNYVEVYLDSGTWKMTAMVRNS